MAHLNHKLKRKQKSLIANQTYGQCKSCWDHHQTTAVYTLPYLKNQHVKYMNDTKRIRRHATAVKIPHPIISVKPFQMIPFIDYYPIDADDNPITEPLPDSEDTKSTITCNQSNHNFHYGSNKWGHQQIRKRLSIKKQTGQYYRHQKKKTFQWKLKERRRSKRRALKNMGHPDLAIYPFSSNSAHFKRNIKENICHLCLQYQYPCKLQLIECETCTKYCIKHIGQSYDKYRACESCWKYYNFCKCLTKRPKPRVKYGHKYLTALSFERYGQKLLKCPFVQCVKCESYLSSLSDIKMYQIHCLTCITSVVHNYGYNDEHYPFICNNCVEEQRHSAIKYCYGRKGYHRCPNNTCVICKDECIAFIDDDEFWFYRERRILSNFP